MKLKEYKLGDITREVWSGDIVSDCEFLMKLKNGRLLFYDHLAKVFRSAYYEVFENELILNGWDCCENIKPLLKL